MSIAPAQSNTYLRMHTKHQLGNLLYKFRIVENVVISDILGCFKYSDHIFVLV